MDDKILGTVLIAGINVAYKIVELIVKERPCARDAIGKRKSVRRKGK